MTKGQVDLNDELIGKVTVLFNLLEFEGILDGQNIGRDIVMGIQDDIIENSEVKTMVKKECLEEMGIQFESEDDEPRKILNTGDSIKGLFKHSNPYVKMKKLKGHGLEQSVDVIKTNQSAHSGNKFKCEVCDKNYCTKKVLRLHIESLHHMKIFKCDACIKTFNRKSSLERHVNNVHIESEISYDCQECDKTFIQKYSLKRHFQLVHRGIKFKCDICDKDFASKQNLRSHIKYFHQN